jgi:hypothetical protein
MSTKRTPRGTVLPKMDGRRPEAKRLRRLIIEFEEELAPGELTASVRAKIGAAAAMAVVSENLQGQLGRGRSVDPATVLRLAEGLERLINDLKATKRAGQ